MAQDKKSKNPKEKQGTQKQTQKPKQQSQPKK